MATSSWAGSDLDFDSLVNFRDVGDGRDLRTGLIYRSEELFRLTPADVERLEEYRLKLIIDLRSPAKHRRKPGRARTRTVNVPILERGSYLQVPGFLFTRHGGERFREFCKGYYRHMAFEQTSRFGEAVTLLADEDHLPACSTAVPAKIAPACWRPSCNCWSACPTSW